MRKDEETVDIEPPQVYFDSPSYKGNQLWRKVCFILVTNQPTNDPQNADEIDKKLKSQEESLRKISEGSSIGEEEDSYLASFNFICWICFDM